MKSKFKIALMAGMLTTACSISAVQRDITVTADIDPTVDITLADGSPLPASITMQYLPGKGLKAYKENIKLWSNAAKKDLNVKLAYSPSLTDVNGGSAIPLDVSINGSKLSTTATTLPYAVTFPSGIDNGSSVMPLTITQATPKVVEKAGTYTGIVSLVVAQATSVSGG